MIKTVKIVIGSLVVASVATIGYWIYKLKELSERLEIINTARLARTDNNKGVISITTTLKNPTETPFNLVFPFVKLYYNDTLIGSSEIINKTIEIPAKSESKINNINISIEGTSVLSTLMQMYKDKAAGNPLILKAEVTTRIELLGGKIKLPYSTEETIQLENSLESMENLLISD